MYEGMYLSTGPNQVKIRKDELVKVSARPSDELKYSQITITYQFRTGFFLGRTSKTLEILVLLTSMIFPLVYGLQIAVR